MPGFTDEIITQLAAGGVVDPSRVRGCSESEIATTEEALRVVFPRAYRTFLTAMGSSADGFLLGSDFLRSELVTLRSHAEGLLRDCGAALALDTADLVFVMHQGYVFLFFKCGLSDDPPVLRYVEGEPSFQQVAESFSGWLAAAAKDEIELHSRLFRSTR